MSRYLDTSDLIYRPWGIRQIASSRELRIRNQPRLPKAPELNSAYRDILAEYPDSKQKVGLFEILVLVVWASICAFYMAIAVFG